jgi:hypothetical protein
MLEFTRKNIFGKKWIETKKDVEEKKTDIKTENKRLAKKIKKDKKESLRKSGREK